MLPLGTDTAAGPHAVALFADSICFPRRDMYLLYCLRVNEYQTITFWGQLNGIDYVGG